MSPKNQLSADPTQVAETPRRIALKQMAALVGLTLSAQALDTLAASSSASSASAATTSKLLNTEELQMTGVIADLVIPATDTPGALATNSPIFMDQFLAECVTKKEQDAFVAGLKRINTIAKKHFGHSFATCSNKQQVQMLTAIEKNGLGFTGDDNKFFKQFKSLTLFAYYTSEIGATKELAYLAIPGGYKGNFPFTKIGKAWALN